MTLWIEWFRCVRYLRPACARTRTFLWLVLALLGLCVRADLAGVTSVIRAGFLLPAAYRHLLHLFHTPRSIWRFSPPSGSSSPVPCLRHCVTGITFSLPLTG